jgi:hypothetical protein
MNIEDAVQVTLSLFIIRGEGVKKTIHSFIKIAI